MSYTWSFDAVFLVQRMPTPEEVAFKLWKENLRREGHTHYIRVERGEDADAATIAVTDEP